MGEYVWKISLNRGLEKLEGQRHCPTLEHKVSVPVEALETIEPRGDRYPSIPTAVATSQSASWSKCRTRHLATGAYLVPRAALRTCLTPRGQDLRGRGIVKAVPGLDVAPGPCSTGELCGSRAGRGPETGDRPQTLLHLTSAYPYGIFGPVAARSAACSWVTAGEFVTET